MKKAFISYRRQDSEGYAHSLYDRLRMNFNHRQIFMDVDDILPGQDFVKILKNNLQDCAVLIVVIGKQWIDIKNTAGARRLENPDDFVRIEVSTAIERGIPVIPVLVSGATMPTQEQLPDNLKALSQRHAIALTGSSYEFGIEQLVSSIERYFGTKRRDSETESTLWYQSAIFKTACLSFFGILALAIYLEEEDIPSDPTVKTPITYNSSPQKPIHDPVDYDQHSDFIDSIVNSKPTPPTSLSTDENKVYQLAKVMKPPSNIRKAPNGPIICQATSSSVITVIRKPKVTSNHGKWYLTNFCGTNSWGLIHGSQIKLRR